MAWSTTRYAQTLDHFIHKTSLIFGGNKWDKGFQHLKLLPDPLMCWLVTEVCLDLGRLVFDCSNF